MHSDRLKRLLELEKSNAADAFIKFAIAQEFSRVNDRRNARKYYEDLMQNYSEYLGTYYHAGQLEELLGQPENALKIYKKGMQIAAAQNDGHALSELTTVYESLKEIQ